MSEALLVSEHQPELTRDEVNHVYSVTQQPIRGVNESIEHFIAKSPWIDDWYRDRGSLAHGAIALALQDDLDWDTLDPELEPFVRAALAFVKDTGWKPVAVEPLLYSPKLWVAGQPDVLFSTGGRHAKHIIVDWKLGGPIPPYELQTAGYEIIVEDALGTKVHQRMCVHLQRDGRARVRTHKSARDRIAFTGLCHALAWKEIRLGSAED